MKTAMGNGTAALLAMQKAMEVESHNAGNTKSLAYKADTVSFADMFYSDSVGQGVNMNTPIKDFSQGGLVPTNSEYDFAIDGEGFFTVLDPIDIDKTYYTRAGQFKSDLNNNLVDSTGNLVLGLAPVVSGDIINSIHSKGITSQIIETSDETISINTYTTDYQSTINVFDSFGKSGSNFKSPGSIISDIEEMLYSYNSALKGYAIDPTSSEIPTKANAVINITPLTSINNAYTIEATVNGVKFQQNFDTDVETTLKKFSDQLSGFSGISSSVDTVTGELMIESMIPGKELSLSSVKLNEGNLLFSLSKAEKGSGLPLSNSIRDEIKSLFNEININLETTLDSNFNALSDLDKFYLYDSFNSNEKVDLSTSLGENYVALQTTYLNDEEEIFNHLKTLDSVNLDQYLNQKYKEKYNQVDLAENVSTIITPTSGSVTLTTMMLDLNKLNMNTTLYDKLVNDSNTVAAYPGIESDNGRLYLRDGDSKFLVGHLVPVQFTDKTLLKPEGDSLYTITPDMNVLGSVPPTPIYIKDIAKVHGTFLENSNVDISEQLVNLLGYQKAFEANSKSISTSDEMMKTALALKAK